MVEQADTVNRTSSIPTIDGSACLFSTKHTFTGREDKKFIQSERQNFKFRNVDEVARSPSPAPPMSLLTEGTPFSPANRKTASRRGKPSQLNPPLIPARLEKVGKVGLGLKVSGWSIASDESRSKSPVKGSASPLPDIPLSNDAAPSSTRQTVLEYRRSSTASFPESPTSGSASPINKLLNSLSPLGGSAARNMSFSPLRARPALGRPSTSLDRLRVEQLEHTARTFKPEELKSLASRSVSGSPVDALVSMPPKRTSPKALNRGGTRLSGLYLATKLSPCQQDHSTGDLLFDIEVTSIRRKS